MSRPLAPGWKETEISRPAPLISQSSVAEQRCTFLLQYLADRLPVAQPGQGGIRDLSVQWNDAEGLVTVHFFHLDAPRDLEARADEFLKEAVQLLLAQASRETE